jgi:hypothetical protein
MRHLFSLLPASTAERWAALPPTPAPISTERSGHVNANGVSIYYAVYGEGSPVILLHGGLANADYWGNQVRALAAPYRDRDGQSRPWPQQPGFAAVRL